MNTTTAKTATAKTDATEAETSVLIDALDAVRSELASETYASQGRCVDWLLDLYNVAERPSVRAMVEIALAEVSHRGLVTVDEVRAALDSIEVAWMVDCVFDRYQFPTVAGEVPTTA